MYQVKAINIPKGRSRDKGVLIQTLCKVEHENILLYIPSLAMSESLLFFATKKGFVKQVSGVEFETNRSAISATKLDEDDSLVCVTPLTVEDVIAKNRQVVLLTRDGLALSFPLQETGELKKTSRGVKGITLEKEDMVQYAAVVSPEEKEFSLPPSSQHKKILLNKIKCRKRGAKGQKGTFLK